MLPPTTAEESQSFFWMPKKPACVWLQKRGACSVWWQILYYSPYSAGTAVTYDNTSSYNDHDFFCDMNVTINSLCLYIMRNLLLKYRYNKKGRQITPSLYKRDKTGFYLYRSADTWGTSAGRQLDVSVLTMYRHKWMHCQGLNQERTNFIKKGRVIVLHKASRRKWLSSAKPCYRKMK